MTFTASNFPETSTFFPALPHMIQSPTHPLHRSSVWKGQFASYSSENLNMSSQTAPHNLRGNLITAILQGAVAGLLVVVGFALGFLYRDRVVSTPASTDDFGLLYEADALMQTHYLYDTPDQATRVHGAIAGLVTSYGDPYTFFVEPQNAEIDSGNLAGRFGGIGAEISQDAEGRFVIGRVYRDNPAFEAGLMEGDILTAVDGQATSPLDLNGVLALVRGDVGDPVVLTVQRDNEEIDITVIRGEVLVPSAFWRLLEEDDRIGYIQLTRFTDRAPEEIRQAIDELIEQGAEALILDLRDNGGGLVSSAVDIAGEFLDGGVILYEARRGEEQQVFNAPRGGHAVDIPLVVLVNQNTASASEIVSGAFQDRDRAILIGQKTYGKGSVQLILGLSDGSSIHVTTAEWYTPNHHRLETQGLTPDTEIEPVDGIDVALQAAVEYFQTILSTSAN
jgi:carboxyl-terminal processing protease